MKHVLFIVLFLALFPASAQESFYTGSRLKQELSSKVTLDRLQATAYIVGVHDALSFSGVVCSPNQIIVGQVRDVVQLYLTRNPATLHHSAGELTGFALVEIWPCPGIGSGASPSRTF